MPTAIITTPQNAAYSEMTFGVQFNGGRAIIQSDVGKPSRYGYSFDELVQKFKTEVTGYEVAVLEMGHLTPAGAPAENDKPFPAAPPLPSGMTRKVKEN